MSRAHHAAARAVASVGAMLVIPHAAHAQTVGGQIVGLESHKPVHGASVALVDDSANIVSSAAADTANGMFYIDAPRAGHYRVVLFVPGGSFVSPALQLDSAQTVERRFSVPDVPGSFRGAYFAQDVTTPARHLRLEEAPRYPYDYSGSGTSGLVVTMFVVDEHGRVDRNTVQVINDADYLFAKAVRESIDGLRFVPAIRDGAAVRQVVQLSFGFGPRGKAPPADVVIESLANVRHPRAAIAETTEVLVGVPVPGGPGMTAAPIHH